MHQEDPERDDWEGTGHAPRPESRRARFYAHLRASNICGNERSSLGPSVLTLTRMLTCFLNSAVPAARLSNVCTVPVCSAEILDATGRANPFLVLNNFGQYQEYGEICNYELGYQSDGRGSWLNRNTLAALQSDAIWMDDDSFISPLSFSSLARMNQAREALNEKLESAASIVVSEWTVAVDAKVFDSLPDGEWTWRLEDAVSVIFPQAVSGALATFESVYRSGELVYTSCIEYVSRFFERTYSLAQQLRYVGSLIVNWFRSRRGLSDAVSIFVNERSWYLHHSAHPPAFSIKAEGRFAAMTRRVCFRPLPA